jgi:hypothetical protein
MTSLAPNSDLFSDFFAQLALAHGTSPSEAADTVSGFSFKPGGFPYHLRVHPQEPTQAILEVAFLDLEDYLDSPNNKPLLERVLRALLHLNGTLMAEHAWLISLDEEDVLILSRVISLTEDSVESVQLQAIDGLQRAHALRELCAGLTLEPNPSINPEANLWRELV